MYRPGTDQTPSPAFSVLPDRLTYRNWRIACISIYITEVLESTC